MQITSCALLLEGVASSDPVVQCVLICSVEMRNSRDLNSSNAVGDVAASVPYDGARFAKAHVASEGR